MIHPTVQTFVLVLYEIALTRTIWSIANLVYFSAGVCCDRYYDHEKIELDHVGRLRSELICVSQLSANFRELGCDAGLSLGESFLFRGGRRTLIHRSAPRVRA